MLDYWLDVSRFSKWTRPAIKLSFSREILDADLAFYRGLGVRHFSTFGVYIDADYVARFGVPPIAEYGEALASAPY